MGLPRGVPHLGLARRRPLAFLPARRAAPRRASLPLPLRQVTPGVWVMVRVRARARARVRERVHALCDLVRQARRGKCGEQRGVHLARVN